MMWTTTASDISVIIASMAGVYSLLDWRRTYFLKQKIELAEKILILFYRMRDALDHVRSPFALGSEGSTRKQDDVEDDDIKRHLNTAFVPLERLRRYEDIINELFALRYRYVLILSKSDKPFNKLHEIIIKIQIASKTLSEEWPREPLFNQDREERRQERVRKAEEVIWKGLDDEDTIIKDIGEMISRVEDVCKPHIEAAVPLWKSGWLWIWGQWKRLNKKD